MTYLLSTLRPTASLRRRTPVVATWIDRVFDDLLADLPGAEGAMRVPALDVAEDPTAYTVALELPGVDEQEIQIEVVDRQLTVRAERKAAATDENTEFHRREQYHGSLARSMTLPEGTDPDRIEATYDRGILTLRIPKVEPTPARRIRVKTR